MIEIRILRTEIYDYSNNAINNQGHLENIAMYLKLI